MQACRHAGMQACRHAGMQACRHAGMQACRHAGRHAGRQEEQLLPGQRLRLPVGLPSRVSPGPSPGPGLTEARQRAGAPGTHLVANDWRRGRWDGGKRRGQLTVKPKVESSSKSALISGGGHPRHDEGALPAPRLRPRCRPPTCARQYASLVAAEGVQVRAADCGVGDADDCSPGVRRAALKGWLGDVLGKTDAADAVEDQRPHHGGGGGGGGSGGGSCGSRTAPAAAAAPAAPALAAGKALPGLKHREGPHRLLAGSAAGLGRRRAAMAALRWLGLRGQRVRLRRPYVAGLNDTVLDCPAYVMGSKAVWFWGVTADR
jgi:hypothetical protein